MNDIDTDAALTDQTDPEGVGKALADLTLANAIDDLWDDSRDTCREHADLEEFAEDFDFGRMVDAYRKRAEELQARIPPDLFS